MIIDFDEAAAIIWNRRAIKALAEKDLAAYERAWKAHMLHGLRALERAYYDQLEDGAKQTNYGAYVSTSAGF